MTALEKKVFTSSNPMTVLLSCPPLCGHFSIQESASGGLSYKAKKQQIFSDLLLVCRCDGRCVIQLLAVKVKLEQAFYQLLNDMLLHFHIDMTVYFGIGADISGVMGKDSSNGFRVALACLDYRFIGE